MSIDIIEERHKGASCSVHWQSMLVRMKGAQREENPVFKLKVEQSFPVGTERCPSRWDESKRPWTMVGTHGRRRHIPGLTGMWSFYFWHLMFINSYFIGLVDILHLLDTYGINI